MAATEPRDTRLPITLLTGFLGSGKTTLLNALLQTPALADCAVLINEVGAVGIDQHLVADVQSAAQDIVLLPSGCLCCAVQGDLVETLRNLFMRRLRREIPALKRVVIETSGLADPAPIVHTLLKDFFLAERYLLDGVITTVDSRNLHWQLAQHSEARRQLVLADRVVLTKCDLITDDEQAAARAAVMALNPTVTTYPAALGAVPVGLFDDLSPYALPSSAQRWLGATQVAASALPSWRAQHHADVRTYLLRYPGYADWSAFSRALDMLLSVCGEAVLRLKGLVHVRGEATPRVVHAVQHQVYPARALTHWQATEPPQSELVFIVQDLPESVLQRAFTACFEASPERVES